VIESPRALIRSLRPATAAGALAFAAGCVLAATLHGGFLVLAALGAVGDPQAVGRRSGSSISMSSVQLSGRWKRPFVRESGTRWARSTSGGLSREKLR
jgi:hypothetical protein